MRNRLLSAMGASLLAAVAMAQQIPDTVFTYRAKQPAYAEGKGTVVVLDEAHNNFHTLSGRYRAFGEVLTRDGYVMRPGQAKFTAASLADVKILVIANALDDSSQWTLPTAPAFTKEEAAAVKAWVEQGGSLFLIADHMPFGGAAARLGRAFGFNWIDGYAMPDADGPEVFSRERGDVSATPITDGGNEAERIDRIMFFTGSAFLPPPEARTITALTQPYTILLPQQAGAFSDTTAWIDGRCFINGAQLEFGKGRVVAFGEAAMFSAQLAGPDRRPMGMNHPEAAQNPQLLLNIIHWLDRRY